MRKIRDSLRPSLGEGLSLRPTAASLQMPFTTVGDHLRRAKAAGITWPLPECLVSPLLCNVYLNRLDRR